MRRNYNLAVGRKCQRFLRIPRWIRCQDEIIERNIQVAPEVWTS